MNLREWWKKNNHTVGLYETGFRNAGRLEPLNIDDFDIFDDDCNDEDIEMYNTSQTTLYIRIDGLQEVKELRTELEGINKEIEKMIELSKILENHLTDKKDPDMCFVLQGYGTEDK